MLGNCLTGVSVALSSLVSQLKEGSETIELFLGMVCSAPSSDLWLILIRCLSHNSRNGDFSFLTHSPSFDLWPISIGCLSCDSRNYDYFSFMTHSPSSVFWLTSIGCRSQNSRNGGYISFLTHSHRVHRNLRRRTMSFPAPFVSV